MRVLIIFALLILVTYAGPGDQIFPGLPVVIPHLDGGGNVEERQKALQRIADFNISAFLGDEKKIEDGVVVVKNFCDLQIQQSKTTNDDATSVSTLSCLRLVAFGDILKAKFKLLSELLPGLISKALAELAAYPALNLAQQAYDAIPDLGVAKEAALEKLNDAKAELVKVGGDTDEINTNIENLKKAIDDLKKEGEETKRRLDELIKSYYEKNKQSIEQVIEFLKDSKKEEEIKKQIKEVLIQLHPKITEILSVVIKKNEDGTLNIEVDLKLLTEDGSLSDENIEKLNQIFKPLLMSFLNVEGDNVEPVAPVVVDTPPGTTEEVLKRSLSQVSVQVKLDALFKQNTAPGAVEIEHYVFEDVQLSDAEKATLREKVAILIDLLLVHVEAVKTVKHEEIQKQLDDTNKEIAKNVEESKKLNETEFKDRIAARPLEIAPILNLLNKLTGDITLDVIIAQQDAFRQQLEAARKDYEAYLVELKKEFLSAQKIFLEGKKSLLEKILQLQAGEITDAEFTAAANVILNQTLPEVYERVLIIQLQQQKLDKKIQELIEDAKSALANFNEKKDRLTKKLTKIVKDARREYEKNLKKNVEDLKKFLKFSALGKDAVIVSYQTNPDGSVSVTFQINDKFPQIKDQLRKSILAFVSGQAEVEAKDVTVDLDQPVNKRQAADTVTAQIQIGNEESSGMHLQPLVGLLVLAIVPFIF